MRVRFIGELRRLVAEPPPMSPRAERQDSGSTAVSIGSSASRSSRSRASSGSRPSGRLPPSQRHLATTLPADAEQWEGGARSRAARALEQVRGSARCLRARTWRKGRREPRRRRSNRECVAVRRSTEGGQRRRPVPQPLLGLLTAWLVVQRADEQPQRHRLRTQKTSVTYRSADAGSCTVP